MSVMRVKLKIGRQKPQHFVLMDEVFSDEQMSRLLSTLRAVGLVRAKATVSTKPSPVLRSCGCCSAPLERSSFASRQWHRSSRVCSACAAYKLEEQQKSAVSRRIAAMESFRPPAPLSRPEPTSIVVIEPQASVVPQGVVKSYRELVKEGRQNLGWPAKPPPEPAPLPPPEPKLVSAERGPRFRVGCTAGFDPIPARILERWRGHGQTPLAGRAAGGKGQHSKAGRRR